MFQFQISVSLSFGGCISNSYLIVLLYKGLPQYTPGSHTAHTPKILAEVLATKKFQKDFVPTTFVAFLNFFFCFTTYFPSFYHLLPTFDSMETERLLHGQASSYSSPIVKFVVMSLVRFPSLYFDVPVIVHLILW